MKQSTSGEVRAATVVRRGGGARGSDDEQRRGSAPMPLIPIWIGGGRGDGGRGSWEVGTGVVRVTGCGRVKWRGWAGPFERLRPAGPLGPGVPSPFSLFLFCLFCFLLVSFYFSFSKLPKWHLNRILQIMPLPQ